MENSEETSLLSSGPLYNIMIDATFLFDQYSDRGIGRYGKELLKRLLKIIIDDKDWDVSLIGFNDLERNLVACEFSPLAIEELSENIQFYSLGEPVHSTLKNRSYWKTKYKPIINTVRPHVFFAVHFERGLPSVPEFLDLLTYKPKTVVTAHDAIPLVNNKFSSKSFIHNFFKKRFYLKMWDGVVKADLVLTDSNFSKKDIIEYGKTLEEKIKTVYLGIDETFDKSNEDFSDQEVQSTLNRNGLNTKDYFFYDSGVEPNKGTEYLLGIVGHLIKEPNLPKTLVVTGRDFKPGKGSQIVALSELARNFLKEAKNLGILENIVTVGNVVFDDVKILLFNAKAHFNFSQYEGFNFPTVQAMRAKIPAIAANTSCIPEITAGGAFLVETVDLQETANLIKTFLSNENSLANHIERAYEISLRYTWDKTAEQTWSEIKAIT